MPFAKVTIVDAVCNNPTWDNALQVDGKGDEVYFRWDNHNVDTTTNSFPPDSDQTGQYGDSNGFPGRIPAGSLSGRGGITRNDVINVNRVIWQGNIGSNQCLAITPSIWEWDGGTDLFNTWGQLIADNGGQIARAVAAAIGTPAANSIVNIATSGLPALFSLLAGILGRAGDRPIGMIDKGSGSIAFEPQTLILTEANVTQISQTNNGVSSFNFQDENNLQGNYSLHLKVDVIGAMDDGTLVKEQSDDHIYVVYGVAKFWIPDPQTVTTYGGFGRVQVVPNGALARIPFIPRDGTLLRELDKPNIYLMTGGLACWIPSPAIFAAHNFNWTDVRQVPHGSMAAIPRGPDVA